MSQSQIHYTEHSAEIHTAARIHHLSPTGCTAVQADEQFEFRRNLWHQKTKNFVIVWHYGCKHTFSRFDTIPECVRQTDRHTTTA